MRIHAQGDESLLAGAEAQASIAGQTYDISSGSRIVARRCLRVGDSLHLIPRRRAVSVTYKPGPDAAIASDETLDDINALALPRYQLIEYLAAGVDKRDDLTPDESEAIRFWRDQPQRNINLIGFARTLIYKRLGSSGPAFIETLRRHRLRNDILLFAIQHGLDLPTTSGSIPVEPSSADVDDGASDEELPLEVETRLTDARTAYNKLAENGRVRLLRPSLFTDRLERALRSDNLIINGILERIVSFPPNRGVVGCGDQGCGRVRILWVGPFRLRSAAGAGCTELPP